MNGWGGVPAHRKVTVGRLKCIVDGFKWSGPFCSTYFLSHFHSDHYQNLSDAFTFGQIHCSVITSRLLPTLGVHTKYIVPHEFNTPFILDDVQITLIEANHCPGAAQILFQPLIPTPTTTQHDNANTKRRKTHHITTDNPQLIPATCGPSTILHTGDFRWDDGMKSHPCLVNFRPDTIYLDTTYSSPSFCFPLQSASISHLLKCLLPHLSDPSTLILLSSYVVGKERIFRSIAAAFNCLMYVSPRKYRLLQLMGTERMECFTTDMRSTRFHICGWAELGETWPYFKPNFRNCDVYLAQYNEGRMEQEEGEDGGIDFSLPLPSPSSMNGSAKREDEAYPFISDEHRRLARLTSPQYSAICGFVPTGWVWSKSATLPPAIRRKVDGGQFEGSVKRRSRKEKQAEEEAKQMRKLTTLSDGNPPNFSEDEAEDPNFHTPDDGPSSPPPVGQSSASSLPPHVIYLVPYSEHSSFAELQSCVKFFKPRVIIPTVFGDAKHANKIVALFRNAVDRTANVRTFLQHFGAANQADEKAQSLHQEVSEAMDADASELKEETVSEADIAVEREEKRTAGVKCNEVIQLDDEEDEEDEVHVVGRKEGRGETAGLMWYCHACQRISPALTGAASVEPSCVHCSSSFIEEHQAAGQTVLTSVSPPSPSSISHRSPIGSPSRSTTSSSSPPAVKMVRREKDDKGVEKKAVGRQLSLSAYFHQMG